QGTKSINALQGANRGLIQRRHATRLLNLYMAGMPVTSDVKNQIHLSRLADARIDLIFQPIIRDLPADGVHVPSKAGAEIAAPTGETKASFCAAGAECAVRTADGAALPERHDIIGFFHRLRLGLPLAGAGLMLELLLCILFRDRDRLRLSHFRLGL